MIEIRVDIVDSNSIYALHPSASSYNGPRLIYTPNFCIKAASRKQTVPSLKGSRPEDGSYPELPPGWYATPRSWSLLPVAELTKSEPLITIVGTAKVDAQSARTAAWAQSRQQDNP